MEEQELTCDVAVVGTGPAGMAAIAAAAATGADVIAVEAARDIGGNAVRSTGYVTFVGSRAQRDMGLIDTVDDFVRDARAMFDQSRRDFGIDWDGRLIRRFAEASCQTFDDLHDRGIVFSRLIPRPKQHRIDRLLAVENPQQFAECYRADFARPNVRVLLSTGAARLKTDGAGCVVGLHAHRRLFGEDRTEQRGARIDIMARNGVVLCSGGYQANPALRLRYQPPQLATALYPGMSTCRGDGHLIGAAIGGDLVDMTMIPPLIMCPSQLVEDMIAVGPDGKRFHDEAGPYRERVAAIKGISDRAYYILDDRTAREKAAHFSRMPGERLAAQSIDALADDIGCDPARLSETVDGWNRFLASDSPVDPDFGRVVLPTNRRPIVEPPFHAAQMLAGINFTAGGFRVADTMQVVDVFGAPIRGLYAAGDTVGGLNAVAELGGIHLGGGFTFGRLAGAAAAKGLASETMQDSIIGATGRGLRRPGFALIDLARQEGAEQ